MSVLTSTGEVLPRNSVYNVITKPYKKHKKKRRTLAVKTTKHTLTEKQAQWIIDRQIARKLRRMF
ncbi:hypothetical protein KDA08_05125 [Candidatus Saccharibacteria bacterium]|nr:hypothetical protein [Candidatus Saccharibacteria bacterium]